MIKVHQILLEFLENDEKNDLYYLIDFIHKKGMYKTKDELKMVLQIILKMFNNHQRNAEFIDNVTQILVSLDLKQHFSNTEIKINNLLFCNFNW